MVQKTFNTTVVILLIATIHLLLFTSEHIKNNDHRFYDLTSQFFQKTFTSKNESHTVIVDIDEKSLHHLGQWPWPRVLDAKLIETIHQNSPSAIGVNILFPESDRVSPLSIQQFYKRFFNLDLPFNEIPEELQDNDKLLGKSIQKSNATLSIYLTNSSLTAAHCDKLNYKKSFNLSQSVTYRAKSILCNDKNIQSGIKNFGFLNAERDQDGTLRRIPVLMEYQDKIFPSFALATLLSFDKNFQLQSDNETILINFSGEKPKAFSAVNILNGSVPKSELEDKIVIVGSSVIGLSPTYQTSTQEKISNSMVHAFVIENLLSHSYITQPEYYKILNIFLSFLLSIVITILFNRKRYLFISMLFLSVFLTTSLWLSFTYIAGIYISIGYFWLPLLYVFVLTLTYHLKVLNQESQEREKFLIKQSKLASMGEMISLISHQWRQPLSAINGTVLNIDMDYRKDPLNRKKLDNHLNKIEETTAYLSKTIHDFSNFFSNDKHQEKFYISDIVLQARTLTPLTNDEKITIIYTQKKNTEVIGYKSELLQSILILLNNAIYACKQSLPTIHHGYITIETEEMQNSVLISIQDNGGGIDEKYIKKIFNPYFTTKEKPHGTGLGLYILKLIVEDSMNGKVSVHNDKKGAIFTIEIPTNLHQQTDTGENSNDMISLG